MIRKRLLTRAAAMLFLAVPALMLAAGSASASLTAPVAGGGSVTLSQTSGTAGTPYASGQVVNVVVTANSVLSSASIGGSTVNAVECLAVGGVDPTTPTGNCDGATINEDIAFNADGSSSFTQEVYALPDTNIGDSANGVPACGLAPNYCVLYIGTNQNLFSAPHIFSAPFQVHADAGDAGTNPGDGTPESPFPILLPIIGAAIVGGGFLVLTTRRRRRMA
jgi:hypothetical protein